MPSAAVYVSSHGFGHAVRVAELVGRLLAIEPRLTVHVRSIAPRWLFPRAAGRLFVHPRATDVGVAQHHGLAIDLETTLAKLDEMEASWDSLLAEEAAWVDEVRADLVLGDIPPLGIAAAACAGIPAIGLGNFSWDWIYGCYARRDRRFAVHAARAAACYQTARCALRLPFSGGMDAFPSIIDVPLIVRRSAYSRAEARARLGLASNPPIVLLSFGGFGFPAIAVSRLARMPDIVFVTTDRFEAPPPNLIHFAPSGVDYTLLLRAADAVVTKPGWGTVAASLVNGVRVLYTAREDFPEAPILARALEEHATAKCIAREELESGEIRRALEPLLAEPVAETSLRADGADRAAEILLAELPR